MIGVLDYNTLLQVLNAASSPLRGPEQQAAEAQLKSWEAEKGFHYLLQSIYINTQLTLQVRWLAVICLKNGIERYWRPTRINAITKEEKLEIRKRLFNTLGESNNQLTIQNAHLVAKIARLDFPVEWPTLFEEMIQILEFCSNNMNDPISIVKLNNLMIISNQILKILATVRIGKARLMMQTKAPIVFPHLVKFYTLFFDQWITNNNFDLTIMEVGYIFLKNIRRLIVDGYEYQNRDKYIQEFMELSLQHFQKLLLIHDSNNNLDLLERYIKCYVKLYFNLVRDKTCSFVLLTSSKNILLTLLSLLQQKASLIYNLEDEANDSDFWEKIAIKSFIIMKTITNYVFKQTNTTIIKQKNDKVEIEHSIELLKSNFFTLDLIENLINLITNWYLKLRPIDLENWNDNPEEWFNEEASMNWEYQIRKCAENYFQDLSIHFNEFISQFIMTKIENLNNNNLDLITKDSILCIFQLSSNSISKKCNFNQLLIEYFIPQALSAPDDINSKIIKRRVCLIINDWLDTKIEPNVRIEIYKFLLTLLSNHTSNDKVVKLNAVQTLKYLIDDWEFRKRSFQSFIDDTVRNMLLLLDFLSSIESKIFILNTLSLLLERTNPLVDEKLLIEIVTVVPILWQKSNSANDMIIKNSLLRILKDLIISLNKNSSLIHDVVIPLIPICCDPKSEFYSLLCEDGLELWSSIMKTIDASELTNSNKLFDTELFEILVNCLINWTEILPLILTIIRSYFLISLEIFNNEVGLKIFEILKGYLRTMRDDSVFLTSSILEIAILQNNNNKEIFYSNLIKSGLFEELIEYLIRDTDSPYCEIKISLPLLRMMIDRPDLILSNISSSLVLNRLLGNLTKFTKNAFDPKVRKLYLLGLLSLYQHSNIINTELVVTIPLNKIDNIAEVEYELEKIDKDAGISTVLVLYFKKIVDLSLIFIEEIRESSSGDLKAYHKQTAYDDTELQPYEPEYDDEEGAAAADNEYALEVLVPPNAERLRYTALLQNCDSVRRVLFKEALRGVVSGVYDKLGGVLPPDVVEELKHVCS